MKKTASNAPWRMWIITLLALAFALLALSLLVQRNDALVNIVTSLRDDAGRELKNEENDQVFRDCDIGSLCLRESMEGGIFGVVTIESYVTGPQQFQIMGSDVETCTMMHVQSANDARVIDEIGEYFPVSLSTAERFASASAEAPASLLVYISERVGYGTSPCHERVHVLN